GIPNPLRELGRFSLASEHTRRTRQHRYSDLAHERARLFLDSHQPDYIGRRPDEFQSRFGAYLGEGSILAEKSVAGMDRIDIGDFGGADDGWEIEIAARTFGRTDADGAVGKADMGAVAIGFGINRDGLDAKFLASADHPHRDLSPIGDQDPLKR